MESFEPGAGGGGVAEDAVPRGAWSKVTGVLCAPRKLQNLSSHKDLWRKFTMSAVGGRFSSVIHLHSTGESE